MRIHADPDPQPWTKPSTNVIMPERNCQNPTFHIFFLILCCTYRDVWCAGVQQYPRAEKHHWRVLGYPHGGDAGVDQQECCS